MAFVPILLGIFGTTWVPHMLLNEYTSIDEWPPAKRALAETSAIVGFNTTNLRGQDIAKLHGIRINMIAADAAVVHTDKFSAEANVTIDWGHSPDGVVHGGLSFRIPGLDTPAEATFVTINETAANDKKKADFQKVHKWLQTQHNEDKEISLEEAITSLAEAI